MGTLKPPLAIVASPPSGRRAIGMAALLLTLGCASPEAGKRGASHEASGAVTWDVSDVTRVLSADTQAIRRNYVISLRNTTDRVIQLEQVDTTVAKDSGEVIESHGTRPFRRTLGPGSSLRIPMTDDWDWTGWRDSPATLLTLNPMTVLRRFSGTNDRGMPVEVEVRFPLDPSLGRRATPLPRPLRFPAATRLDTAGDVVRVVGLWRGSYRLDHPFFEVPVEVAILADGTFHVGVNDPVTEHFRRTILVRDGALEYSGSGDRGTLTFYESAGPRMLSGRVSLKRGRGYDVYLEAEIPPSAVPEPPPTPTAIPVSVPSSRGESPAIDLTGRYRGTLTGIRARHVHFDRAAVEVVQSGHEFSATWTTPSASGTLVGNVIIRTTFTFRLRQEIPCAAAFGGLGTIDDTGSRVVLSYRGGGCEGISVAGSLVVTREMP